MANRNQKGFSLAEAMMATVVLSIVAVGVFVPYTTGAMVQVEGVRRTLAANLAGELMEKIVRVPFDNIVTSYGSYSELAGEVKDMSGVEFIDSAYDNFSRDATCEYVYVPQESGAAGAKFILAAVRVYYKDKEMITLSRLISR